MSEYDKKRQEPERPTESGPQDPTIPPIIMHPPIIIDGGSVILELDGDEEQHYEPDDVQSPTSYFAGGLRITAVHVIDRNSGGATHICPNVPSSGDCTVTVQGKRSGHNDSPISVASDAGSVEVGFDHGEYPRTNPQSNGRKKFRGELRKIKSVQVLNNQTGDTHDCPVPANGKCRVIIRDSH